MKVLIPTPEELRARAGSPVTRSILIENVLKRCVRRLPELFYGHKPAGYVSVDVWHEECDPTLLDEVQEELTKAGWVVGWCLTRKLIKIQVPHAEAT